MGVVAWLALLIHGSQVYSGASVDPKTGVTRQERVAQRAVALETYLKSDPEPDSDFVNEILNLVFFQDLAWTINAHEAAREYLHRRHAPDSEAQLLMEYASVLSGHEQYVRAMQLYSEALSLVPAGTTRSRILEAQADCQLAMGNPDGAIRSLLSESRSLKAMTGCTRCSVWRRPMGKPIARLKRGSGSTN